jgi:hypothetical protein
MFVWVFPWEFIPIIQTSFVSVLSTMSWLWFLLLSKIVKGGLHSIWFKMYFIFPTNWCGLRPVHAFSFRFLISEVVIDSMCISGSAYCNYKIPNTRENETEQYFRFILLLRTLPEMLAWVLEQCHLTRCNFMKRLDTKNCISVAFRENIDWKCVHFLRENDKSVHRLNWNDTW